MEHDTFDHLNPDIRNSPTAGNSHHLSATVESPIGLDQRLFPAVLKSFVHSPHRISTIRPSDNTRTALPCSSPSLVENPYASCCCRRSSFAPAKNHYRSSSSLSSDEKTHLVASRRCHLHHILREPIAAAHPLLPQIRPIFLLADEKPISRTSTPVEIHWRPWPHPENRSAQRQISAVHQRFGRSGRPKSPCSLVPSNQRP
ncbi:hypothetical protein ACLOJK_003639 [Asimina triloba]